MRSLTVFLGAALALGCTPIGGDPETDVGKRARQAVELRCKIYGGIKEKVCPVSAYLLIVKPKVFDGRFIAIKGVARMMDSDCYFFPDSGASEVKDVASSLRLEFMSEVEGRDPLKCNGWAGTLIGRFTHTSAAEGGLFEPVGTLRVAVVR